MHAITRTLPVGDMPYSKMAAPVNRRRAPGVLRLGFNGYGNVKAVLSNVWAVL